MAEPYRGKFSRRTIVKGMGLGAIASVAPKAFAQTGQPVKLSFWTYENPETRPWLHKRIKLFTEQNPNVQVDFQWFTFGDLGKKISVGFATGTAPDGFVSQDWFMPVWLAKGLLAPLDVGRIGYKSYDAFTGDFTKAFVDGATRHGKVYGYPAWFYGFCNYLNTNHFKEVGLDPEKDWPQSFEQLGEVARRLTIKSGDKFVRQGFKFAMHTSQWTMIQFNPILIECGGTWFDAAGKCTVNSAAGVKAMTLRASIAKQYGAEDPADSIPTNRIPQMDWLRERCSMFWGQPQTLTTIGSENPKMRAEGYFRPVQYPGVIPGKGISTNLRLQSRDQCAGLQGEAGSPARSLQVHLQRPDRLLGRDGAVHAGPQERLEGRPTGKTVSQRRGDHHGDGSGRVPGADAGLQRVG
jgi:ABC-type glycerol-3-phosphate transport system substrate-binding protein